MRLGMISVRDMNFVIGTIYTAVLEKLNLAELTWVEFSAILSILYQ